VRHVAEAHAHVTGGSSEVLGLRRRPAPKGGGAAAPASLRARQYAQKEREISGGYCSPREGEAGELEGQGEAAVTPRVFAQ
jgi:hypothetical protein